MIYVKRIWGRCQMDKFLFNHLVELELETSIAQ